MTEKKPVRVRWKSKEHEILAEGMAEIQIANPHLELWACIKKAQVVLDPSRRRVIVGRHCVPEKLLLLAEKKLEAKKLEAAKSTPPPVVVEETSASPVVPPEPLPAMDALAQASLPDLLSALGRKLGEKLDRLDGFGDLVVAALEAIVAGNKGPKPVPAAAVAAAASHLTGKKKVVIVCGFDQADKQELIREKTKGFDLKVSFHSPPKTRRDLSPPDEMYFVMLDTLKAHYWVGKLRGTGRQVHLVADVAGALKALADINARGS